MKILETGSRVRINPNSEFADSFPLRFEKSDGTLSAFWPTEVERGTVVGDEYDFGNIHWYHVTPDEPGFGIIQFMRRELILCH